MRTDFPLAQLLRRGAASLIVNPRRESPVAIGRGPSEIGLNPPGEVTLLDWRCLVIIHATAALSSTERTAEEKWREPTNDEWRQAAKLAATYSDDDELNLAGERMSRRILSRAFPRF